jgi:hypothetical protein
LSASTFEGDTSSGDESEYAGLEGGYLYPAPFVVRNTFIEFDEPDMIASAPDRCARSCPASKVVALASLSSAMEKEVEEKEPQLYAGEILFNNTFVHFPSMPQSLAEFVIERNVQSCPTSALDRASDEHQDQIAGEMLTDSTEPEVRSTFLATPFGSRDHQLESESMLTFPEHMDEGFLAMGLSQGEFSMWGLAEQPRSKLVVSLAESLPEPAGLDDLPSVGSAEHWVGTCKPCAFTHKGCSSGKNCPFCHLCDPGEKKRRRKEKVAYLRSLRRWKKENGVH